MLVVDRFEEDTLVCVDEGGDFLYLARADVLSSVREGDVLRAVEGGYTVDKAATAVRRQKLRERLNNLFDR